VPARADKVIVSCDQRISRRTVAEHAPAADAGPSP